MRWRHNHGVTMNEGDESVLNASHELVLLTVDHGQVIVGQLAHTSLYTSR
jgi:hypothetical protein